MPLTTSQEPPAYLTISEAARLLGVSTRTILRYEQAGKLPAHRLPSGHRRFNRSDIEQLLAAA